MRRVSRVLLIGTIVLSFRIISPALAHAEVVSSDPPPGAQLTPNTLPGEISIMFNKPLAEGSAIRLFESGFDEVEGVTSGVDPSTPERLVAALPSLQPGQYTVAWTAISSDGHEITGSYAFVVEENWPATSLYLGIGVVAVGTAAGFALARSRRRAP